MLSLKIAQEAEQQLIDIGEYIQEQWGVNRRAEYIKNLVDRFNWLAKTHTRWQDRGNIREGFFSYREGRHLIFYTFTDTSLEVVAILHEKMDFEGHI